MIFTNLKTKTRPITLKSNKSKKKKKKKFSLCISKDKKVYVIMLISLLKFLRKISKLPWMEDFLMRVKDVQEW